MIQISTKFLLIITLINIFLYFLLRYLIKKNIFLNSVGYLTIFFQGLVIILAILRQRNFGLVSFAFTLFFLLITNLLITYLPYIIDKTFSDIRKKKIEKIEQEVKLFLLEIYDNFLENKPRLSQFCWSFSEKLTFYISKLIYNQGIFWFLLIPWLFFIYLFVLETIITQNFVLSPYFFAYFLIINRILSLSVYVAKNTLHFYFIKPLRENFRNVLMPEFSLKDFVSLRDLVLNSNNPTNLEKITAWHNLNLVLSFSCEYFKIKFFYYFDLPFFKKVLDIINLFIILLSVFLNLLFYFGFSFIFSYFFFLLFLLILAFFLFYYLENFHENSEISSFKIFLLDLPEFLKHFQYILVSEHQILFQEIILKKPFVNSIFYFYCWKVTLKNILFVFLALIFTCLSFLLPFEFFTLLHQVIKTIVLT